MARPIADRAAGRIAVLGAASPSGAYVKAALADRGVSGARVDLFGHLREVAVLSEYDGEARLVQPAAALEAEGCAAVFVCEPGHEAATLASAAASGTLVVDLTGSLAGTALAGAKGSSKDDRLVSIPHPVTQLLMGLLAPVHAALGLTRVSSFVLRPASDFGEPGLEELREQTVRLLRFESTPTDVFGRQLAFNVVPEHLFPGDESGSSLRIVRETRLLLDASEIPASMSQALVPSFYGHAVTAHLEVEKPDLPAAIAAWRGSEGVTVTDDPETGTTLDAPDVPGLIVARVAIVPPSMLTVWALGSEAGASAAARAIAAAADAGVL